MRTNRQQLARLLSQLTKVVNSRNIIPVLGTVRLVADGKRLTVTATDLDIEITGGIEAEGEFSGCIDAKMLAGIVGKLSGDDVDIDADGSAPQASQAVVKAGRSRFKLQVLPVDDFPTIAVGDTPHTMRVDLAALTAPVQFAISTEETRYYLNGIFMHEDGGKLTVVATDGHRLARNIGSDIDTVPGIIVPRKTVALLPKGEIDVSLSDTKIRFDAPDVSIVSKLIDGTFPDYKRVIPSGNDKIATIDNAAMRQAVERVSTVAGERGRAVKLSFGADTLALTVNGEAEANDELALGFDADAMEIGFNAAYLSELLGNLPSGEVRIALADSASPTLFTSPANDGLLAVLMPMRV